MSQENANNTTKVLRDILIVVLGGRCSCQGNDCWHDGLCHAHDKRCLQIDHIKGDGATDRKRLGGSAIRYYFNHIEEARVSLQLLCANCNWVKRVRNREVRNGNGNGDCAIVATDDQVIVRLMSYEISRTPRFLELTDKFYGFHERLLECADTDMFDWLDSNGLTGNRSLAVDLARHWRKLGERDDSPEGLARFVDGILLNLESIILVHNRRVEQRLADNMDLVVGSPGCPIDKLYKLC